MSLSSHGKNDLHLSMLLIIAYLLCSAVDDFYDDWNKPKGFVTKTFLDEVLLSYRLLFGDDQRSRKLYAEKHRQKACNRRGGVDDPVLDELCNYKGLKAMKSRTSYNKGQHFPILGSRLAVIQEDTDHLQLNNITALWHDRRDLSRWYTFWAVLIIGGIGIILSGIQTLFTIVQTVYTIKS